MAKQKYALNPKEKIVFKSSRVRHGFWGAYTNTLTVTNQSVILEKYGLLNNFKGIERFSYSDIRQAILGKASNGEKQLELYIGDAVEEFALQSGDETETQLLVMAINDQMGPLADSCDFSYYQRMLTEAQEAEEQEELAAMGTAGLAVLGDAAKNLLRSGNFSAKGVTKSIEKAVAKQQRKAAFGGVMDEVLDDLGIRDIQDEFIELGNEFREEFGLKPKMTHAERKKLEKKRKQAAASKAAPRAGGKKTSVKEQMDLLQQLKSLLDAGVLTQEEFEKKKREILNG